MGRKRSSSFASLRALLRASVCVLSVVMMLLFPAVRPHSFGAHFRAPQVRRAFERHTSIAHSDSGAQARVPRSEVLPRFFVPAQRDLKLVSVDYFDAAIELSLSRLLNRSSSIRPAQADKTRSHRPK
jgi:hypothetical protein